MDEKKVRDTSLDYDDMIGKKAENTEPNTLLKFFDIDEEEDLRQDWQDPYKQWNAAGMPPFNEYEAGPWKKLYVHFRNEEDLIEFAKLVGQSITPKTKTIWFPGKPREENVLNQWVEDDE